MFVVDQRQAKAGNSGMLGLIIPESTDSSRFLAGIRRGIEAGAGRASSLLVGISEMDPWREIELLADMIRHRVAGVLVVASTGDRPAAADARLQALIAGGPPLVFVDRRPPGFEVDWITSDNELAGRSAGEALLAQGHRRIAFVWAHECVTVAARRRGLETAMAKHGLELDPQLARGGWDPARDYEGCGYLRTLELFHLPTPPTAIFTGNDAIAWGALRALRFLGRRVPDEVSIIGVDDHPLSATFDPPLSSVRQDTGSMGLLAIEQVRRRIAGDVSPAQVHLLPTTLVERSSVARLTAFSG